MTELLSGIDRVVSQFFLDTEDLVELGQTLGAGRRTGLDLSGSQTHNDVGNGHILGLTGAVGHHNTPVGGVGVLGRLDRLGQGTDLVDLEEQSIARLQFNGLLDADRVGDGQVITTSRQLRLLLGIHSIYIPNNLEVGGLVEVAPCFPVVFRERIFNTDDGVLAGQRLV